MINIRYHQFFCLSLNRKCGNTILAEPTDLEFIVDAYVKFPLVCHSSESASFEPEYLAPPSRLVHICEQISVW